MKCDRNECQEDALSFDTSCWEHLKDRSAYRAALPEALRHRQGNGPLNLRKISLRGLTLEKIKFDHANLSQADLSSSHLFDVSFNGADLVGADFSDADLSHCTLMDTDLTKAHITHARLWNADLTGANLTECDMADADAWNACLHNVRLWHTDFATCKSLGVQSFVAKGKSLQTARVNEAGFISAEESYRNLKSYFLAHGMYKDASWASYKEKMVERLLLKQRRDFHYFPSLLMSTLCGYGEKPHRIVLSAFIAIFGFAFTYAGLSAIVSSVDPFYQVKLSDYIYFSTITFTTVGFGDFIPKPVTLFRLLAACEAFCGVFLTGLFIFTLARKYSAR